MLRHRNKVEIQRRRRRRLFWLIVAAAIGALLFAEQVAVLYVLLTLATCALMIVVAFSNLEARDAEMHAAAISDAADDTSTSSRELSRRTRTAA